MTIAPLTDASKPFSISSTNTWVTGGAPPTRADIMARFAFVHPRPPTTT